MAGALTRLEQEAKVEYILVTFAGMAGALTSLEQE